ncbi:hypothetical protein HanIR_Chr07g0304311 [Helianthus annuus]|nr:hypothetical protein HanIR_Chr07g0304311 [Helianthus annuus]
MKFLKTSSSFSIKSNILPLSLSLSCCLTSVKTVTGSPLSGDSYQRPTHTPRFTSFRRQPPAKHPPPSMVAAHDAGG